MVARTSVEPHAAWHLIPAESKRYARVAVIETVIAESRPACGATAWSRLSRSKTDAPVAQVISQAPAGAWPSRGGASAGRRRR